MGSNNNSFDPPNRPTVPNVCNGSLADIGQSIGDVRFAPESGHVQRPIADIANKQSAAGPVTPHIILGFSW